MTTYRITQEPDYSSISINGRRTTTHREHVDAVFVIVVIIDPDNVYEECDLQGQVTEMSGQELVEGFFGKDETEKHFAIGRD
jgi:hypothetical protein